MQTLCECDWPIDIRPHQNAKLEVHECVRCHARQVKCKCCGKNVEETRLNTRPLIAV